LDYSIFGYAVNSLILYRDGSFFIRQPRPRRNSGLAGSFFLFDGILPDVLNCQRLFDIFKELAELPGS